MKETAEPSEVPKAEKGGDRAFLWRKGQTHGRMSFNKSHPLLNHLRC